MVDSKSMAKVPNDDSSKCKCFENELKMLRKKKGRKENRN